MVLYDYAGMWETIEINRKQIMNFAIDGGIIGQASSTTQCSPKQPSRQCAMEKNARRYEKRPQPIACNNFIIHSFQMEN